MVEGICWASRGAAVLLGGEAAAAVEPYGRGMAILARLPHAEPRASALWPLLLASLGDHPAVRRSRRSAGWASVPSAATGALSAMPRRVLAGRAGHGSGPTAGGGCELGFTDCEAWGELARFSPPPPRSPTDGANRFAGWPRPRQDSIAGPAPPGRALPRTARGVAAQSLGGGGSPPGKRTCCASSPRAGQQGDRRATAASPRTVEKHVESLLRKTGARSRAGLMAAASQASARDS